MTPLIMPLTIVRNTVNTNYVYLPSDTVFGAGKDLTGYELQAQMVHQPSNTLLATFTCTNEAPPDKPNELGWIKVVLDDSVVIPAGYYRGAWSLLIGNGGLNPELVAAGVAEITNQPTTWA